MKKISLLITTIISLASKAQTNIVTINAHIKGLEPGKWVYYREQGGNDKRDSTKTIPGGFTFKIPINEGAGNAYFMSIERNFNDPNSFLSLYLDKGTVNIQGEGPLFKDANISGNASVRDNSLFINLLKNYYQSKSVDSIYEKQRELYKKNDTVGLAALQPELDKIDSIRTALEKRWAYQHPTSPISALVLSGLDMNTDELERAFNHLSPLAKNNFPAQKIAHTIKVDRLTGIGKTAVDFTQDDTLGKPISLKDFRGEYILLDFWASWCVPCRAENPNLVAAYNKFKSKNFTILSISLDQPNGKEKWINAIRADHLTWTHLSDLKFWNNAVAVLYDIKSVPTNLLLDPNGRIIAKDLHGEELDNKLTEVLK